MMPAHNHPDRARDANGFTLVELMIGIVIAAGAVSIVLTATVQAMRARRAEQEITAVFSACRNQIELLRAIPHDTLPTQHNVGFAIDPDGDGKSNVQLLPADPDSMAGTVLVTTLETSSQSTLYRVEVKADWLGVGGPKTFGMAASFARRRG